MRFISFLFLFSCVANASAYVLPDANTNNPDSASNNNLGAQVAKKTGTALKTFKDVNCDTIGCKGNGAQSFEDNSGDGGQKTFKIDSSGDSDASN